MNRLVCGVVVVTLSGIAGAAADEKPADAAIEKATLRILELTNQERQKEKLPLVKPNAVLARIAEGHSKNMARQQKMAHVLDGKDPAQRVDEGGYDYAEVGEIIAYSAEQLDVPGVFEGWMKSKVHRENILGKDFHEVGIGIVRNAKGDFYYTQVFGTQRRKKK